MFGFQVFVGHCSNTLWTYPPKTCFKTLDKQPFDVGEIKVTSEDLKRVVVKAPRKAKNYIYLRGKHFPSLGMKQNRDLPLKVVLNMGEKVNWSFGEG